MKINKPNRKEFTYVQHLDGNAETAFKMLCPVVETKWLRYWDPELVVSDSGVAEPGCYFFTKINDEQTHWVITEHKPQIGFVEMIKITPGKLYIKFTIVVTGQTPKTCLAEIKHTFTSIGDEGEKALNFITEDWYKNRFMAVWENSMNHYLRTGEMLTDEDHLAEMRKLTV